MKLRHLRLCMCMGNIFPAKSFTTRGTAYTHLEVAKRAGSISFQFSAIFLTQVVVMANLEEVYRLRKLLAIEQISFNGQLGCAVSISLATCSWFSLFPAWLPFS